MRCAPPIRTIENALAPHCPRQFTLPGIGYGARGGFPSGKLAELGYATWQWFKLDNAKANLAADVQYALADFIGCIIDAGPAHSPDELNELEDLLEAVLAQGKDSCVNENSPPGQRCHARMSNLIP
ncbi:MAG: hypothetical protein JF606_25315 [Burkholderiales bacterium]|nr:hypothetical protein [Burkholderiales bacterium]